MLEISRRISLPDDELQFEFSRSSGPGGQNVNKVNSKVTLRWHPGNSPSLPDDVKQRFLTRYASRLTRDGELLLSSQKSRDRERNRLDCLTRLQGLIQAVLQAPRVRRATRPTRASKERRLQNKQRTGNKKKDRRWSAD